MWVFDNLLYKVVALLVAALLWAAAQGATDAELSLDLPISVENVPDGLVVVAQSAYEINLRLSGSRAALRQAQKTLVSYPVSLEGVGRGEVSFPVSTEGLSWPRGAEQKFRSPSTIYFTTEPIENRRVRIAADIVGKPPEGYRMVEHQVVPSQAVLSGARGSVGKIREIQTDRIDLSRLTETTTIETQLVPPSQPNVWAKDGNAKPIKVRVVIEALEKPPVETPEPSEAPAQKPGAKPAANTKTEN